jgi:hypothetical protein
MPWPLPLHQVTQLRSEERLKTEGYLSKYSLESALW